MGKSTRGSRDYPETALPPISVVGETRVAMDRADGLWKASENGAAYVPILTSGGGVLQTVSANLAVGITTTATPPVYTTLLTAPLLTTTLAASRLRIEFYCAWNHSGGFAGNVAANFRFRLNGTLIGPSRGTTGNQIRGRIDCVSFCRVLPVVAGGQTVLVEWSGFALGVNTLNCIPVGIFTDLFGAQLIVQELPP